MLGKAAAAILAVTFVWHGAALAGVWDIPPPPAHMAMIAYVLAGLFCWPVIARKGVAA